MFTGHPARWLAPVCIASLAFFLASAAFARADEPAKYTPPESTYTEPSVDPEPAECPVVPEELSSAEEEYSDELVEMRWQRIAMAHFCEAVADRLDEVSRRLWWAVVEAAEGRGQRQLTNEKLTSVAESLYTLVNSSCSNPCSVYWEGQSKPVTIDQEGALEAGEGQTAELVSSIDSGAEASKIALYILIGLVVGLPIAAALWRTTHRGL